MNKRISFSLLFLFVLNILYSTAQQKRIPYGNNSATGKYYSARGIKLYYEVYGKGKPLLLIHGNGGSINAFENNIPFFAKHFKVIAVDSRAQGRSTDSGDSLSFEMMTDDFAALLTAMHIDSAYVVGWSDGAINAIIMALRHPEKVIKFAATGANLWSDSTSLIPSLWKEDQQNYEANKNKLFSTPKEKNDWKLFMLDLLQPNLPLSALRSIKCPALIIAGDHDLIATQHTVAIYENIKNANLWIVPNSSHGTLVEHADDFNRTVLEFFKQKSL